MIWREIFLSKNADKSKLSEAFCNVLNINVDKINLIDNLVDFGSNYNLTCVIEKIPGDFCLKLDCYSSFEIKNEIDVISNLCKIVNCQALITNDEQSYQDNIYSFILFKQSGQTKIVEVDSELLEENNELKII